MTAFAAHWTSSSEDKASPISGELTLEASQETPSGKGRRARRVPITLGAGLRQRGAAGVSVQVMDLSTDGFRVGTHLDLAAGSDVWLRLPGLEPCHARVMWCEKNTLGCAFVRPLHPAVLEMIVARGARR